MGRHTMLGNKRYDHGPYPGLANGSYLRSVYGQQSNATGAGPLVLPRYRSDNPVETFYDNSDSQGTHENGKDQFEYQDYGYPHGSNVQEFDVFESSRYDLQSGMTFQERQERKLAARRNGPKRKGWQKVRNVLSSGTLKAKFALKTGANVVASGVSTVFGALKKFAVTVSKSEPVKELADKAGLSPYLQNIVQKPPTNRPPVCDLMEIVVIPHQGC